MLGRNLLLIFAMSQLPACGGRSANEPDVVVKPPENPPSSASVPESVDTPLTSLERAAVVETVEEGLGRFLQEVKLEESVEDGKFEGFRIVGFSHPERWVGVGLLVGDVIVSVNDSPIERPEQAYAVFVSLKTAPAVEVSYLRHGEQMRLSLPIVGEAKAPGSEPSSPKVPAKMAPETAPQGASE